MANVKFKVLREALPSVVSGTVDFTSDGFGDVQAAIFIYSGAATEATR